MTLLYRSLCAFVLAGLVACSPSGDDRPAATLHSGSVEREVMPTWREDRAALGKATYATACASCHETGDGGAPITGKRDQWEERSEMWQAVLFRHAKSGYLEMPGKGGHAELTDESVEAATEYMLGLTYPELLRD